MNKQGNKKLTPKNIGYTLSNLIFIFLLLVFDQWTKSMAYSHLRGTVGVPLIPKAFELFYVENRGIAFGLFQNMRAPIVTIGIVILLVVLFVLYKIQDAKYGKLMRICLLLIAAGGIGNMLDRILRGFVVDFFYFSLIRFPVFNLADVFVVCGTFVLCFLMLLSGDEEKEGETTAQETKGGSRKKRL